MDLETGLLIFVVLFAIAGLAYASSSGGGYYR